MKRHLLSFLDLVTLFLMSMIVIATVSARPPAGVGRAKQVDAWEVIRIQATAGRAPGGRWAWSDDESRASVAVVPTKGKALLVLIAARDYVDKAAKGQKNRTTVHVNAGLNIVKVEAMTDQNGKWYTIAPKNCIWQTKLTMIESTSVANGQQ